MAHNKFRVPILPIVVFSYDEKHIEKSRYDVYFPFFHVLSFNFLMLELRKMNWRNYIESDNPVAVALLSKMGYREDEKVQVKLEFLKMLVRMNLNPAESRFINDFFEYYLILDDEEEGILMKELKEAEFEEEVLVLTNSWEEKGKKRGLQEGLEKGKQEEKIKAARRMINEGLTMELIIKITGLGKEKVEELINLKR